jgi:hypothetical protein
MLPSNDIDRTLNEYFLNGFRPNLFTTAVFQELTMLSLRCQSFLRTQLVIGWREHDGAYEEKRGRRKGLGTAYIPVASGILRLVPGPFCQSKKGNGDKVKALLSAEIRDSELIRKL